MNEGDVLAGKYRIEKTLGAGGMGVVVAAHHLLLDERVAIKFLLPEALGHPDAVARFIREARAAVKIKSEHVAQVTDVGTLDNGAPYMVMEYLDGSDLHGWLEQKGRLPIEQAVEFVLQACEAIADAHGLGIIHRDLKPANLFCIRRSDGVLSIKVLDFGISKVTGPGASGQALDMTKTAATMGSPLYMSPEQLQSSRDVDARTDIWSIGVILYELLTGVVPFGAETLAELCIKIAVTSSPPLRTQRPDAPPALEKVVSTCLERDRNKRYPNVAELATALAPFGPTRARASVERIRGIIRRAGLSATALVPVPPSESNDPVAPIQTVASWGQTAGPSRRKGRLLFVGASVGLVLTGLVVVGLTRNHSPSAADLAQSAVVDLPSAAASASLVVSPSDSTPRLEAPAPSQSAAPAVSMTALPDAKQNEAPPGTAISKKSGTKPTQADIRAPTAAVPHPPKPIPVAPTPAAPPKPSPPPTTRSVYDDRR